ncbi:MAG: NUDIX hydrolase [Patescibacteria group bacterium]
MIKKWEKLGPEETLLEKFGKFARKQSFIDPRDKSEQEFIFVGEPNSVGIVALTKEKAIVLIRQFKQAADEVLLEIPAGVIDKGEEPIEAAKRELEEETGYRSNNFIYLHKFMKSTRSMPTLSFSFLALDCEIPENAKISHEEELDLVIRPFAEWLSEVKKGEVLDPLSTIATLLASEHIKDAK